MMKKKLKFYNNIEEALLAKNLIYSSKNMLIKKILKIKECDEDCIVFFIAEKHNKNLICMSKLKIKKDEEYITYSNPVLGQVVEWKKRKQYITRNTWSTNKTEKLMNLIRDDIQISIEKIDVHFGDYCIRWGIALDDRIKEVNIDDRAPSEIIELELDNDIAYLWYYDNWKTDDESLYNLKISFSERL